MTTVEHEEQIWLKYLDWGKIEIRSVFQQFSILPLCTGWGGKAKSSVYAKNLKMAEHYKYYN